MSISNDSILVTPGSGATVATQLVDAKEYQVVMIADSNGHFEKTTPTWIFASGNSANVAAARTTHFDMFNATGSGKIVVIEAIYIIPTLAAVTGVGLTWEIIKTSAVGTTGSALTARPFDSSNTAIGANVTARSKPGGGATTDYIHQYVNTSSEETIAYGSMASILNHVPAVCARLQGIVLRENQGIKIDQTTNSSVGSTNIQVIFTIT